jgi:Multicopper oxidase
MNFVKGKKYRLRLVNTGLYSHFRFAIDGHNLTVIAMDFVPIVPYTTDNVCLKPLGMGGVSQLNCFRLSSAWANAMMSL